MLRNDTDSPKQVELKATLPQGWNAQPAVTTFNVAAHDAYAIQFTISSTAAQKDSWQTLKWDAESDGKKIGSVTLRVQIASNGLPQ